MKVNGNYALDLLQELRLFPDHRIVASLLYMDFIN